MTAISEADARQKWCPFAREPACMPDGTSVGVNRLPQTGEADTVSKCIASECMAWRWRVAPYPEFTNALGESCRAFEGSGYCGLAGAP